MKRIIWMSLAILIMFTIISTGCAWLANIPWPTPTPTPDSSPTPDPCQDVVCNQSWETCVTGVCVGTPPPEPTPEPTPTPILPLDLTIKMNAKVAGQGFDSTPVTVNEWDYCASIGLGYYPNGTKRGECPLAKEGDPNRLALEKSVLNGCPIWEGECYATNPLPYECPITFDHFDRDDPHGVINNPNDCQTGSNGHPVGGFWVVAHGKGRVRACAPNTNVRCSVWLSVDH